MIGYDVTDVRQAAKGRWLELLQSLGGLTPVQLSGKNQPCPKCGGRDRFAAFRDVADTGGLNCRQCHDKNNGDGFASLQWLTGEPFGKVLAMVAERCGVRQRGVYESTEGNYGTPKKASQSLGRIVATYDYRDESGRLLFQATRHEPKTFRQRAPKQGPEGGWTWSLAGVRLVPYRLPELVAADKSAWVLIAEGEKDVDALRALGFVATCNPMGAGKWRDEFSAMLAGRPVAVLPDNDDPGRAHGEAVASSLLRAGCRVRVVPVAAGKDAADWIAAGATRETIAAAIEAAIDCEAGGADAEPIATEVDDEPQITTLVEEMQAALARHCTDQPTLVTTGMPELDAALSGGVAFGEIVVIAARPSHGKSAVGLQLIHHWTELGYRCAFCSEEMTTAMVGERSLQFVTDVNKGDWQRRASDVSTDVEQYARMRETAYVIPKTGDLTKLLNIASGLVDASGVRCVIVDYAQQLGDSKKRSYDAVTEVSKRLAEFARRTNVILVALAQHSRAVEGRDSFTPRNSDLKESGQIEQDADVILHLVWPWMLDNKHDKDEYQIHIGKNRNREIASKMVSLVFDPSRQAVRQKPIYQHPSYEQSFAYFNRELADVE